MSIDFHGTPIEACVPGDRTHRFRLPVNRDIMPPKTLAALEAVQEAVKASAKAREYKAQLKAGDAVREAVAGLYEQAMSTSSADSAAFRQGYEKAAARYRRALEEAEEALQEMVDYAQLHDNPAGIGFPEDPRSKSQAAAQLHLVADALQHLPAPSGLQER
jgi:hypothetical protein